MRLVWYQRADGLWNAACACNATIVGATFEQRAAAEERHFVIAGHERAFREKTQGSLPGPIPACGPKLPEPNPNIPGPPVFP